MGVSWGEVFFCGWVGIARIRIGGDEQCEQGENDDGGEHGSELGCRSKRVFP